jgi:hypothetical protein
VIKLREGDKLHFSPKYIFADIDFDDRVKLINAFNDRAYGFYLNPAKLLDNNQLGFACGLMCAATIDFLARLIYQGSPSKLRIENWLKDNIKEFNNENLAVRFYKDFRCGIVHEGRIKNPGEFSYQSNQIVTTKDGIIRINPGLLLRKIEHSLTEYLTMIQRDSAVFDNFRQCL